MDVPVLVMYRGRREATSPASRILENSRKCDISRAHFQGTAQRLIYISRPAEDRQAFGEGKVGGLIRSTYGTQNASHIWQLHYVTLICGELGGKNSAAFFHNSNEDVRMAVHCGDFLSLSDVDGLNQTDKLLKSKCTAKDMETLRFEDSDVKKVFCC